MIRPSLERVAMGHLVRLIVSAPILYGIFKLAGVIE